VGGCRTIRRSLAVTYAPSITAHSSSCMVSPDLRCNIVEGEQLFVALKRLAARSCFVACPTRAMDRRPGRPRQTALTTLYRIILEWFAKYLQPASDGGRDSIDPPLVATPASLDDSSTRARRVSDLDFRYTRFAHRRIRKVGSSWGLVGLRRFPKGDGGAAAMGRERRLLNLT